MENNQINEINDSEVLDISILFEVLKRNKKSIFIFSSIGVLLSSVLTLLKPPIYQGNFQIIVEDNPESILKNDQMNALTAILNKESNKGLRTQLEILKSPSVLLPVFENIKNSKLLKGNDVKSLRYEDWIRDHLEIDFKKNTSVLEIKYKDKEKDIIYSALRNISDKYQEYSKSSRQKFLQDSKNFLNSQVGILSEKLFQSTKKLNEFSLKHSLGPNKGNYSLSNLSLNINSIENSKSLKNTLGSNQRNSPSSRYDFHFNKLKIYESNYIDLSSKLKPNSQKLKDLSQKIENLKLTLKRPIEILIKYEELQSEAQRLSATLNSLETELTITELSLARQEDPWKLISDPTIADQRISPSRKNDVFLGTFLFFIIGCIFSLLKENLNGTIYNFEKLERFNSKKFLGNIYKHYDDYNDEFISSIVREKNNKFNQEKIGVVYITDEFINKRGNNQKSNYFKKSNFKHINHFNIENLKDCDYLILTYKLGQISKKTINLANDFMKVFNEKILGWMIIDDETKL